MKKWHILFIMFALLILIGVLEYFAVRLFTSPPAISYFKSAMRKDAAPERFPVLSRFEVPRNYGYFIGDEIPLTLVLETTGDVILDLVNLPGKGEQHGVFEVRNVTITSSSVSPEKKIYRAAYTLQYFGPTPLITHFGPLEILYALPKERVSMGTYAYQRLFTQPVSISLSRIGPFQPTQALEMKKPMDDPRSGIIWTTFIFGAVCVLVAGGGWSKAWWKNRQQGETLPGRSQTAVEDALRTLQDEETVFFPPVVEPSLSAEVRLAEILREYIRRRYSLPVSSLTTAELASSLAGVPLAQELLSILERCEALKYAPPSSSRTEERELWWEATVLFQKLQVLSGGQ